MVVRTIISAKNLRFSSEDGLIDMDVEFAEEPGIVTPFTSSSTDKEVYGRDIYFRAIKGEWGPIKPYVWPDISVIREKIIRDVELDINSMIGNLNGYAQVLESYRLEEAYRMEKDAQPTAEEYPILAADVGFEAPTLKAVGTKIRDENRETHKRLGRLERLRVTTIAALEKVTDRDAIGEIVSKLGTELISLSNDPQITWEHPVTDLVDATGHLLPKPEDTPKS